MGTLGKVVLGMVLGIALILGVAYISFVSYAEDSVQIWARNHPEKIERCRPAARESRDAARRCVEAIVKDSLGEILLQK